MFIGQYQHNIDDKCRLVLPTKYRDKIGKGSIITIGFEGCLTIYPESEYLKTQEDLRKMPMTNRNVRNYLRVFEGSASEAEFDKQGRIKIPAHLIRHAHLEKECVIVGLNSVIEVWALDRWKEIEENGKNSFEELAENISGYDFKE